MTIRRARKNDLPAIKRLIAMFPRKVMQNPLSKPGDFFVAINEGQIIASCALEVYSKRLAEIRSLAVAKAYQHRGIGTKLIQLCLQRAKWLKVVKS